jgi:hypothetical protein
MPATSRKQQKWAFAQLEKREKGQKGDTNMTETQLEEFTHRAKGAKKGKK